MRTTLRISLALLAILCPSLAIAQEFRFERTFDAAGQSTLDVSTQRGRIEVVAGEAGRIVVTGAATVRVGWNVPADAVDIARRVAAAPPIERDGNTLRLRRPSDAAAQRAVTVSYRVQVPPNTEVRTSSDSGATSVRGIAGAVDVKTQSAAIDLGGLAGTSTVATGSGAIDAAGLKGALLVTTRSGSFAGSDLGASLHVRTQSGSIDATLTGSGDVDVETASSSIRLHGVRAKLTAKTQSGQIAVRGVPGADWSATTGSSAVTLVIDAASAFTLDASSRSASVVVEGAAVQGTVGKRAVVGTVNGGGPQVRIRTGSGAIRVQAGGDKAGVE